MSRAKRSADRVREEIPIVRALYDYGYQVDPRAEDYEQQFCCDLHGDGKDSKPSARVYPGGGQFFCFACGRSRDIIGLVREKEGLDFWRAIKALESRYGLPPLPWDPEEDARPLTPIQEVEAALRPRETGEQALQRVGTFLLGLTRERSLSAQKCAGLWEAHDRVISHRESGGSEESVKEMAHKILTAAKKAASPEPEE